MRTKFAVLLGFALVFAVALWTVQAGDTNVKIKEVPMAYTSAANAQEMFNSYCAACHGVDARGNGPAVPALKTLPPDLTLLSQTNGGKFPMMKVMASIRGEAAFPPAHGAKNMPIWGPLFSDVAQSHAQSELRIHNLSVYIESLQAK